MQQVDRLLLFVRQPWLGAADRIIARFVQENGGIYDPEQHLRALERVQRGRGQTGEPTAAERVTANVRRLDRLARFRLAVRLPLHDRLEPIFDDFLDRLLKGRGWGTRDALAGLVREQMRSGLASAKTAMSAWRPGLCQVPAEFGHGDLEKHRGKHLVDAYRDTILRRAEQSLFLARCVLDVGDPSEDGVRSWVEAQAIEPVKKVLMHVVDDYLDDGPDEDQPPEELLEMAERECIALLEEQQSIGIVGRFDGANSKYREAHRRNFNRPFNPFVLHRPRKARRHDRSAAVGRL